MEYGVLGGGLSRWRNLVCYGGRLDQQQAVPLTVRVVGLALVFAKVEAFPYSFQMTTYLEHPLFY